MDIYLISGSVWLSDVPLTSSCEAVQELMKEDYVQLVWNSASNAVIPVGAYIVSGGERYSILEPYTPEQRTEDEWVYKPKFQSAYRSLSKVPFFMYTTVGADTTKEADWTLTDNPANFMTALCNAIYAETGIKYDKAVGSGVTVASATCDFNCLDIQSAIGQIASAFETEIWLEKYAQADGNGYVGKLHMGKAQYGTAVELEVGVNVKVPSVTRNSEFYNRFYVFGSARNITQNYQGANVNNLATKRLTLSPTDYPGGYIDFSDGGQVFSKVLIFEDIYPSATDLVVMNIRSWLRYRRDESTSEKVQIGTDPVTGDPIYDMYAVWFVNLKRKVGGSYVDFTFNNTTYDKEDNPTGMLLPGLVPSFHFNSGPLAGREFEVIYHDTAETVKDGTDGSTFSVQAGDFEIKFIEEGTYIIPAVTGLIPQTDDLVVLFNVMMPADYVEDAEDRLETAALEEINKNYLDTDTLTPVDRNSYQVDSDPTVFSANDPGLTLGRRVNYVNGTYEKESRITRLVKKLAPTCYQTITFGDEIIKGSIEELKEEAVSANRNIDLLAALNKTTSELTAAYERTHQLILKQLSDQASMFLVVDGTVKLNPIYSGLWAEGWLSAGGVGSVGGGGGGASWLNDLNDVAAPNPAAGDLLSWDATANSGQGAWVNVPRSQVGTPVSLTNGNDYSTLTVNSVTAEFYTKSQVDSIVGNLDVNTLVDITTSQDGILTFEWSNGDTINVDLNHEHSDYVPVTRTINGVDLSQNRNFYTLGTPIAGSAANGVLYQVDGISYNPSSVSANSDLTRIEWNPNAGGTGIGAWHIKGNLYADGWIAAGGIGNGGGGGGTIFLNSSIADVSVDTTSLSSGHILQWNGTSWVNTTLSVTANPATTTTLGGVMVGSVLSTTPIIQTISSVSDRYYYIQCDSSGLAFVNVPWTGGSGSASWGTYSSSSHTIELTVNGTSYVLCENGYSAGGGVSSESDPVFTASPAYSLDSTHVTALMSDDYALKTGGSTYNFLVNTLKFSLGTLSAENYGMTGLEEPRPKWTYTYQDNTQYPPALVTKTKYLAYKDEIPTTLKNPYALTFGSYTYDGSQSRTLTAGSIGAVTLAGAETITGAKTMTASLIMGADIYPSTDLGASLGYSDHRFANGHIQTLGSTTLYLKNSTTGNNSAMLTANGGYFVLRAGGNLAVSYKQLNFDETDGLYPGTTGIGLGKSANRWGDLYMSSTAKIQLGPVTIEYDSVNYALRVHGTDNNHVIGLYCDGFVAAGGVQASE